MRKNLIVLLLLLLLPVLVSAEYFINNCAGFPILSQSLGVRPSAMGGAFTGLANDINAIQYNPAGLGTLYNRQFILMHDPGLAAINTEYLAYTAPAWGGNIAYSFLYHHTEDIKEIVNGAETSTSWNLEDMAVSLSYGRHIWKWFYYGMNLRHAYLREMNSTSHAATMDIGILFIYDLEKYISDLHYSGLGISIMNIFPGFDYPLKAASVDMKFRIGTGFSYKNIMSLSMDIENTADKSHTFRLGYEIFPLYFLALRAGYVGNDFKESNWDNFTFGAGLGNRLRYGTLSIDVSAKMKQAYGMLYELSFHWIFNRPYLFTSFEDKMAREKSIQTELENNKKNRQDAKERRIREAEEKLRLKEEARLKKLEEAENQNIEELPAVETKIEETTEETQIETIESATNAEQPKPEIDSQEVETNE